MQSFQRIVRDVLLVAAIGATAAAPADSLVGHVSFEELADASIEEFMPWGLFGGGVLGDLYDGPLLESSTPAPAAAGTRDGAPAGPQVELLPGIAAPDPTSCVLLLAGLGGWALWRRRVQRRRHAGGIGAYLIA